MPDAGDRVADVLLPHLVDVGERELPSLEDLVERDGVEERRRAAAPAARDGSWPSGTWAAGPPAAAPSEAAARKLIKSASDSP